MQSPRLFLLGQRPEPFLHLNFVQTPLPPLILPTNGLPTYPVSTCSVCRPSYVDPLSSLQPVLQSGGNLTAAQWLILEQTNPGGDPLD